MKISKPIARKIQVECTCTNFRKRLRAENNCSSKKLSLKVSKSFRNMHK